MHTTPCTTGTGMTERARRAFQNRDSPHLNREKEGQSHCHGRPTVGVTGGGAGVDNVREQDKPEARKMLENAADSPTNHLRIRDCKAL